jgi:biopolymer transport protein ExbD
MTPLIDIVFQLLIFFICASTGHLREFLLPVDFGAGAVIEATELPPQPLGEVWVRLEREGGQTVVTIEGTRYPDWERVRAVLVGLGEITAEIPVILDIGDQVPMGDVIRIDDLCRAARFETVSFAADAPPVAAPTADAAAP